MCRYDDDYDWLVADEQLHPLGADTACEDCGRRIPAGEPLVDFTPDRSDDDVGYTTVAFWPTPIPHLTGYKGTTWGRPSWWRAGLYFVRLINDDDAELDRWQSLGWLIDEVNTYELDVADGTAEGPAHHYSCAQCRAANLWLREVCDQSTVLVTTVDLDAHRDEYTDDQLGPDFVTLHTLSQQRWRSKHTGQLISPSSIERLARDAAAFALAGGLVHE